MTEIHFRAIIEVMGKPKEHIVTALQSYLKKLEEIEAFTVLATEVHDPAEQENELWTTFAEVEIKTKQLPYLTRFCVEFMPSMIEIISPSTFSIPAQDMTGFLNDLQTKLHNVDMVAKQAKMVADASKESVSHLLRNYITLLLRQRSFTGQELSNLTGVSKEKLEDFLDVLIDKGKVDLDGDVYSLKKEVVTNGASGKTS